MKKYSKGTMLIILLLVLITVSALVSFYFIKKSGVDLNWNTKIVDIPLIKTSVVSSSDNVSHNLNIKFSLGVDKALDDKDINVEDLKVEIVSILSDLDYNKICKKDGLAYIKSELKSRMDKDDNYLDYLYITDIQADNLQNIVFDNKVQETKKERVFKSLFPSMR